MLTALDEPYRRLQETALRALARIRAEDKEAFAPIRRALAVLADQPHPGQAVAWGGSDVAVTM